MMEWDLILWLRLAFLAHGKSSVASGFADMYQHTQLWKEVFQLKENYCSFLCEASRSDSPHFQGLLRKVNPHRNQFMKTNGFLQTAMSFNWGKKIHQEQIVRVKHHSPSDRKVSRIEEKNTPRRLEMMTLDILTRSSWQIIKKDECNIKINLCTVEAHWL